MAEFSKIQWTTHSWNPWRGCTHATLADGVTPHPGCTNCYAEAMAPRNPAALGRWGTVEAGGVRVVGTKSYWDQPRQWNQYAIVDRNVLDAINSARSALYVDEIAKRTRLPLRVLNSSLKRLEKVVKVVKDAGGLYSARGSVLERPRVFFSSISDVFEDWRGPMRFPDGGKMDVALPAAGVTSMDQQRFRAFTILQETDELDWLMVTKRPANVRRMLPFHWQGIQRNAWLLSSVSDQQTADEIVPLVHDLKPLFGCVGISLEPMLGPVKLLDLPKLDWVIVGGESGPNARRCTTQWILSIVGQCVEMGVPCFVKQLGDLCYDFHGNKIRAGRKGEAVHAWPVDLRVREFPNVYIQSASNGI